MKIDDVRSMGMKRGVRRAGVYSRDKLASRRSLNVDGGAIAVAIHTAFPGTRLTGHALIEVGAAARSASSVTMCMARMGAAGLFEVL